MAIAGMLGTNTGAPTNRPSVMQRAANDNTTKVSSDLLNLGLVDFVTFLAKITENLRDINDFSRKVLDGFKKAILSIANLDRDIRFKFTYLQKDIEASRNDFLAAIKALSFDGGEGGGGEEPFEFVNKEGAIASLGGGLGIPPIPDVTRPRRPGRNPPSNRPTPGRPNPSTRPSSRLQRMRERFGFGGRTTTPTVNREMMTARRTPGEPVRARPASPTSRPFAPNINVPGATVSMQVGPTAPAGTPAKTPAAPDSPTTPKPPGAPTQTAPKVKPSIALKGFGALALTLGPIVGAIEAKAEMETFQQTGNKENLKNVYGIVGRESSSFLGGLTGTALGAAVGGPAAPITAVIGGILGSMQAGKLGEIVGRSYYNVAHENMKWDDAIKLETLRYDASVAQAKLDEALEKLRVASQGVPDEGGGPVMGQRRQNILKMQENIDKLTKENRPTVSALREFEKQLEEAKAAAQQTATPPQQTTPPAGTPSPTTPGGTSIPGAARTPITPGRGGIGGPDLEMMSRSTSTMGSGLSQIELPAISLPSQTETFNVGESEKPAIANHPNFPLDASNDFVMNYMKTLFNPMGNVPTRTS